MRFILWIFALATLALAQPARALAQAFPPDPIEQLRADLKCNQDSPAERQHRLEAAVKSITDLDDMHRAIALLEWRDEDPDPALADADNRTRRMLTEQFTAAIHQGLKRTTGDDRTIALDHLLNAGPAAQRMLIEIDALPRLSTDLAAVAEQGDSWCAQLAIRSLVRLHTDPATITQVIRSRLKAGIDPAIRVLAARAASEYVRRAREAPMPSRSVIHKLAPRKETVNAIVQVLPVAALAANDADRQVRQYGMEAISRAAGTLADLIKDPDSHRADSDAAAERLEFNREREELRPLIEALKTQAPILLQGLDDTQYQVRLLARRAWEDLAASRQRLEQQASNLNIRLAGASDIAADKSAGVAQDDPLSDSLRLAVPALSAAVADPDPGARRRAIDVLEMLGPAARPAAPMLVRALSDPDRFVRWAAARTLGRLGPIDGLNSARALSACLADSDLDVRLAAAAALEQYGPAARTALTPLIKALDTQSPELKLAIIKAFKGIGKNADIALPALRELRQDRDPRVRRAASELIEKLRLASDHTADSVRSSSR